MLRSPDKLTFYLLFCLFLSAPSTVWSAWLAMDYSVGFNGRFQINKWTPITITMENTGKAINGVLEVVTTSGSEYRKDVHQTVYSMDLELPTHSKKLCSLTVRITSAAHEMAIRFRRKDKILVSKSLNLRRHFTDKSLVLVLGGGATADFLSMLPENLYSAYVRPRFLPEAWYGYDGVTAVVIRPEMFKYLRERQFQALVKWINNGGFLVSAGGINTGSLLGKRMTHILPMKISGHKKVFKLVSLETFCGQKLTGADPFLILNADIYNSEVLIKENGTPIITQKKIGIGKVIFISFDFRHPPFSRWPGRRLFWKKILSLQPSIGSTGIDLDDQKIMAAMLSQLPARFPYFTFVLSFIGVYVLLLNFLLKRLEKLKGDKWRNFIYLLIVITFFSIMSCFFFFYPNHKKSLTANSFFHINMTGNDVIASGKKIIGLYSIKNKSYNLSLGPESHPVFHLLYNSSTPGPLNTYSLHETDSGKHIIGTSDKWSHLFFVIRPRFEFKITGRAHLNDQGLKIAIENNTPYRVSDSIAYFDGRFLFLGDVFPGEKKENQISESDTDKTGRFDSRAPLSHFRNKNQTGVSSFFKPGFDDLINDLLIAIHSKNQNNRQRVVLMGWIRDHLLKTRFVSPNITDDGLTLLSQEITVGVTP